MIEPGSCPRTRTHAPCPAGAQAGAGRQPRDTGRRTLPGTCRCRSMSRAPGWRVHHHAELCQRRRHGQKVPVKILVRHPVYLPALVLLFGIAAGLGLSRYRAYGRPRDLLLTQLGRCARSCSRMRCCGMAFRSTTARGGRGGGRRRHGWAGCGHARCASEPLPRQGRGLLADG